MKKIIKYVIIDILRNRIMLAYAAFLLAMSLSIFNLEDSSTKGMLSLLNIVLIIVPLVSLLFASIYIYNSAEFIELLVSQPLKRKSIWISLFTGICSSLLFAFLIGVGLPVMLYSFTDTGIALIVSGSLLTVIFSALALLVSVIIRDKARGIGMAILVWVFFSVLFDGLLLFLLFQLQDYPMEKPVAAISMLNPIDLSRILVLLKMDVSALMGYTGAVFRDIFGTVAGTFASFAALLMWIVVPALISVRKFNRKDL